MDNNKNSRTPNGRPFDIRERTALFTKEVISFSADSSTGRMFQTFHEQLLRSASSIGANVVEGQAGSSKSDWLRFLIYALKSAKETSYWLETIMSIPQTDKARAACLKQESDEIGKIIGAIIVKVKRKN